jgi:1-deoxy-D-xylulose-5-phosphate reductoisomerase
VRNISIIGATGDIGHQALQVTKVHPDEFKVFAISAWHNYEKLAEIAYEYNPKIISIIDESAYKDFISKYPDLKVKAVQGEDSLLAIAGHDETDMVIEGFYGIKGLPPILEAIRSNKYLAVSDALIHAGQIINQELKKSKAVLIPIDSEHSAILQCLIGEKPGDIKRILLSCSGGPFYKYVGDLAKATPEEALKHPTWTLISTDQLNPSTPDFVSRKRLLVDCATLLNKGNEAIEARWLFKVKMDQIRILIHPQSVIQSLVEFVDGGIKGQIFNKSLITPMHFAMSYPERMINPIEEFSFDSLPPLTFEIAPKEDYPCLKLAYFAGEQGGNFPAALNFINSIAVQAFLKRQINFTQIPMVIESVLEKTEFVPDPTVLDLFETKKLTEALTYEFIALRYA